MFGCWCFFFPGKAMCSQNSRSVALVTFNCPIGQFQEEDQVSITFDKFHNREMPKKLPLHPTGMNVKSKCFRFL